MRALASVRGGFDLRRVAPFVVGGALGVPLGVFLLHNVDPVRFKLAIGVLLMLYGLYGLLTSGAARITAGGPGSRRLRRPHRRRARRARRHVGQRARDLDAVARMEARPQARDDAGLQYRDARADADALCAHRNARRRTLRLFAIVAPAMLIPSFFGGRLYGRFSEKTFTRVILLLLLASGVALTFGSARGFGGGDKGEEMGPLQGLRIVEMAGLGPAPFAGMLLSDMGADVIRIDRKATGAGDAFDGVKQRRTSSIAAAARSRSI